MLFFFFLCNWSFKKGLFPKVQLQLAIICPWTNVWTSEAKAKIQWTVTYKNIGKCSWNLFSGKTGFDSTTGYEVYKGYIWSLKIVWNRKLRSTLKGEGTSGNVTNVCAGSQTASYHLTLRQKPWRKAEYFAFIAESNSWRERGLSSSVGQKSSRWANPPRNAFGKHCSSSWDCPPPTQSEKQIN